MLDLASIYNPDTSFNLWLEGARGQHSYQRDRLKDLQERLDSDYNENLRRLSLNQSQDRGSQLSNYAVRGAAGNPYRAGKQGSSGIYGKARGLLDRSYDDRTKDLGLAHRRGGLDLTAQKEEIGRQFDLAKRKAEAEKKRQKDLLAARIS